MLSMDKEILVQWNPWWAKKEYSSSLINREILKDIEKWENIEKESRKAAEIIQNNFEAIEKIILGIKNARERGVEWKTLKNMIENEDTDEAYLIKEIREGDGKVIIKPGIVIDFRISAQENMNNYFDDVKWAKKKLEATKIALKNQESKIGKVEINEEVIKPKKKKISTNWYERFHWAFSVSYTHLTLPTKRIV